MFSFLTGLSFGGRECEFPVPQEVIRQFDGINKSPYFPLLAPAQTAHSHKTSVLVRENFHSARVRVIIYFLFLFF